VSRAVGFLRNLPSLVRRFGLRGVPELLAGRLFPRTLAYERWAIVRYPNRGTLHPEARIRRVDRPEPAIDEAYARLTAVAEPEVGTYTPQAARGRFAAGAELFVLEIDGAIAHMRWVVRDALRFSGMSIPLAQAERAVEGIVTLGPFRNRSLELTASEHIRALLASEGTRAQLSVTHGFNRRFLRRKLRQPGVRRLATVHVVVVAGRRWLRTVPASPADRAWLERRAVPARRWIGPQRVRREASCPR